MANQAWPAGLPNFEKPLRSGFSETVGSTKKRSEMEVGPAKGRRRSTAQVDQLALSYYMTDSQVSTFESFYNSTLKNGSLRFDATHPRTGKTKEFRIREDPTYEPFGNDYRVSFQVEVLP